MQSTQAWSAIFRQRVPPTMFEIADSSSPASATTLSQSHDDASIRAERSCFKTDRHSRRIWCLEYRCPLVRRRPAHPRISHLPL